MACTCYPGFQAKKTLVRKFQLYPYIITKLLTMNANNQMGFVIKKIQFLQTAILHCHSNSILKLPSSLVQTLYTDEVGCVWIAISKPTQYVHEFDKSFQAGLNYYKKDCPFYINTYGIARVVTDPEELNQLPEKLKQVYDKEKLLICVRILQANYYEQPPKADQNIYQKCRQTISSLFYGSNDYYHFDMEKQGNFA
jgi:general stress protein 26